MINDIAEEFLNRSCGTKLARFLVKSPAIIYPIIVLILLLIEFIYQTIEYRVTSIFNTCVDMYNEVVLINTRRAIYKILK